MMTLSTGQTGILWWRALSSVNLLWFALGHPTIAYELPEHEDIGTQARDNHINYVLANPNIAVGDAPLQSGPYWDQLFFRLTDEDSGTRWRQHFWNVAGGDNDGLWGYDSAYTRATRYWAQLLQHYCNGEYEQAYYLLGCVMHLAADMGVPAHVNLDPHPPGNTDWYEHTYISNNRQTSTSTDTASTTLRDIMVTANLIARAFDSNDVDGTVDVGTRRAGGFIVDPNANPPIDEGADIAVACYPAAIAANGAVLKLFFDTVKPRVRLFAPTEGTICSGIKGVAFASSAQSYNRQYNEAGQIDRVRYCYSLQDPYVPGHPGSFTLGVESFSASEAANGDLHWMAEWTSDINSAKVWVRAIAVDDGLCRSLPEYEWITIDSKRPEVLNTKP